jgi:uncharacterized membrane protein YgcG
MEGVNSVTHSEALLRVLEGEELKGALASVLQLQPSQLRSFDYKWLRAVPRQVFTGIHCDSVYMARGSPQLLTCWIPLEEQASLELGALAMCKGSHSSPRLARLRATYGAMDTEAEPGFQGSGWLSSNPAEVAELGGPEVQWVAGDYAAGDVILFGMHTLHASSANTTDRVRLSCDVRWQPAHHAIDERYVGSAEDMARKQRERKQGGAWAKDGSGTAAGGGGGGGGGGAEDPVAPAVVTMEDLRQRWNLF